MSTKVSEAVDPGETTESSFNVSTTEDVEALYREFRKRIFGYASFMVAENFQHAEDITQETFVRVLDQVNRGNEVKSRNCLFAIAKNLVISMFYRGRKNLNTDSRPDFEDIVDFSDPCWDSSIEKSAFVDQALDECSEVLAKVNSKYQEAFIRRRVWGQSLREIGEALNVSDPVAANYVSYGWEEFQVRLKGKRSRGE